MSKQRKTTNSDKNRKNDKHESKKTTEEQQSSSRISIKTIVTVIILGIACCVGYKGYLETRVNTPFDSAKVVVKSGLAVPSRYWGSYRPGNYFGMKTREPYSPVMGLMWYFPRRLGRSGEEIRHWCEQGDNLETYSWLQHDGKTFGIQTIIDGGYNITTSFVKRYGGTQGGDWTARIKVSHKAKLYAMHGRKEIRKNSHARDSVVPRDVFLEGRTGFGHSSIFSDMQASQARGNLNPLVTSTSIRLPDSNDGVSCMQGGETTENTGETINIIFYTAIEPQTNGRINPSYSGPITGVVGETQELGPFALRFVNLSGTIEHQSYLSVEAKGLHLLKETIISTLSTFKDKVTKKKHLVLPGDLTHFKDESVPANFIATQLEVKIPFEFDAVFESSSFIDRPNTLTGEIFSQELHAKSIEFNRKFEDTFRLKEKNYTENYIKFAKAVFSNLIGGIGYFYGASRVRSEHTQTPVPYWKAPLFTAVPSRSFFPRGFLWDEGFHGLLIASWDIDLELDIMSHWFDLMNVEGWIPREQILGREAVAKVPEEFITQTNTNANPPTFFLTLRFIIQNYAERLTEEDRLGALDRLYPRLVAWFDWFNSTQAGPVPGSYRWRGRDSATNRELNPKTLTSGLDDYPRASHPSNDERHLDLRCWVMLGAATLAELAKLLNRDGHKYVDTFSFLADNQLLDSQHWSEAAARYADYGLHTDDVALKRPPPPPPSSSRPPNLQQQEMIRVVLTDPRLRYVDTTFGYVSLFPLFVRSLATNSHKLQKLLTDLRNPLLLWTDYGLRSLAKSSPLYDKRNTEHDPPYWRGAIWINMNYLALGALHYYSHLSGPYQSQAAELYSQLRNNIINNIYRQYKKSGYIWEHYNDKTGVGEGSRPFTGWSSLVVLIMAEMY